MVLLMQMQINHRITGWVGRDVEAHPVPPLFQHQTCAVVLQSGNVLIEHPKLSGTLTAK